MTNEEYESILLGTLIVNPEVYYKNSKRINSLMFDNVENQYVYRAYEKLIKKGEEPGIIKMNKEFGMGSKLSSYLINLTTLPTLMPRELDSMIGYLEEKSKNKIINSFVEQLHNMSLNNEPLDKMLAYMDKTHNQLNHNESDDNKNFIAQLKDFREEIQKRMTTEGITGITTGFSQLDEFTNGWQETDLIIVGGASSMGKTSFAVTLAYNSAVSGKPTAIFSYEMSAIQIVQRIISTNSGVKQRWLNKGALDKKELKQIDDTIGKIESIPLIIDDCNNTSLSYLMTKIKQYVHTSGVKLVMVDYLQLVSASSGRSGNREQEVAKVARGLKNLAKELNVCIMALSQLSRGVGQRSNSRPTLSDLRESGEIEQAADVVVLLYRPEYYGIYENEEGQPTIGLAEIIFAKGRNIGIGTINLKFIPDLTKFEDYE